MKIIGDKEVFAFEIGDCIEPHRQLRYVDIWGGGTRLCIQDNVAYISHFVYGLSGYLRKAYDDDRFRPLLKGMSRKEIVEFVWSINDPESPNYGIHGDLIQKVYEFLYLGPTTDNFAALLFRRPGRPFFAYSFWEDATKEIQIIPVNFDAVMEVIRETIACLEE